jgi:hypothetical protein
MILKNLFLGYKNLHFQDSDVEAYVSEFANDKISLENNYENYIGVWNMLFEGKLKEIIPLLEKDENVALCTFIDYCNARKSFYNGNFKTDKEFQDWLKKRNPNKITG